MDTVCSVNEQIAGRNREPGLEQDVAGLVDKGEVPRKPFVTRTHEERGQQVREPALAAGG